MKKLLIVFCILFFTSSLYADYHYASHEGSNEYPYTSWATGSHRIQDAVDAVEPGDTIYVGSGVWSGEIHIYDNNIALLGMGIDSTIIENYDVGTSIRLWNDTTVIEGFSFYADRQIRETDAISCAYWGFIEVKNNYFYGNSVCFTGNMSGIIRNNYCENNRGLLRVVAIRDSLICENNTIINNHRFTPFLIDDYLQDSSKCHIRNNMVLYKRGGRRMFDFMYAGEDSVFIYNNVFFRKVSDVTFPSYSYYGYARHNIYYFNNYVDGLRIGNIYPEHYTTGLETYESGGSNLVYNNIITNCRVGIDHYGPNPFIVTYSDFFNIEYDLFHGDSVIFENCLYENPMIMDSTDFHLQMFSPCKDTGDPNIFDLDGSRSDMGVYGGPFGELYSYYDLPPRVPDSLNAVVSAIQDTIYIDWSYNTESDFNRYNLHRDTLSGFTPNAFNLIAEPDTSIYIDSDIIPGRSLYYKISAIDNQENMSDYSGELGVIFTGLDDPFNPNLPRSAVLYQNYPNPFNQHTIIKYYLPDIGFQPAEVQINIYDILGRLVKKLVDNKQFPGEHQVIWDGRDERGESLTSGVYFYRLFISKAEINKPRKIVLMK